MIEERNLRFLYPPMVIVSSMLLLCFMTDGYKDQLDPNLKKITNDLIELGDLAAGILSIAFVLFLGHVIGLFTVLFLTEFANFCRWKSTYEFQFSENIWEKINLKNGREHLNHTENRDDLSAGISYDHEQITEENQKWLSRRWNSFFISANCCLAFFLSIVLGCVIGFEVNCTWIIINLVMAALFFIHARLSWKQSMNFVVYQLGLKKDTEKLKRRRFSKKLKSP
ncbi:MAG: hypothetical protein IPM74_12370 [Crocinitomicaceae bacterium]|nr:hypothetical protein [Crocinitomicaceae bacterium]MBK8926670.1 hypothetical protein [Crocinitomicaceae bacterium]